MVDRIFGVEQVFKRGQRGLSPRVEHAVRAFCAPGVEHAENHRNVESLFRDAGDDAGPRAVVAVSGAPISAEARRKFVRDGAAGAGVGDVTDLLKPFGAAGERFGLYELRIIVISAFLLPDVERRLSGA